MSGPVVKVGDRVRVVIDDVVTYVAPSGTFTVTGACVILSRSDGVRVQIMPAATKVGDTIEGDAAYAALPVGAVVATCGTGHMMKTRSGLWADAISDMHGGYILTAARVLVYLPETGDSE